MPNKDELLRQEIQRGQDFINQVYQKMSRVAQEFAFGEINRSQFHRLYERYQQQAMAVAQMLAEANNPTGWRDALATSDIESTYHLKKSLTARALGVSIYDNRSGMPIETIGEFSIDAELIVPMLSSYREAAAEIFQAGVRSTEMENGSWLCFMAGAYTTLIVLFSVEPSRNQFGMLDQLHRDFEIANAEFLDNGYVTADQLAYPFYSFIARSEIETGDDS